MNSADVRKGEAPLYRFDWADVLATHKRNAPRHKRSLAGLNWTR